MDFQGVPQILVSLTGGGLTWFSGPVTSNYYWQQQTKYRKLEETLTQKPKSCDYINVSTETEELWLDYVSDLRSLMAPDKQGPADFLKKWIIH